MVDDKDKDKKKPKFSDYAITPSAHFIRGHSRRIAMDIYEGGSSSIKRYAYRAIEELVKEEDYTKALKKLKDLTFKIRYFYDAAIKNRRMMREKREVIGMLNDVATEIQGKMNKLDKEEPIEWKTPVKQSKVIRKPTLKTRTL